MAYESLEVLMPQLLKNSHSRPIRFFIDTCFALNERAFAELDDRFFAMLRAYKTPLVLPLAVLREIQKHERDPVDLDLAKRSKSALTRFAALEQDKAVRLVGSADDPFADQTFLEVFTKFRPKYTLLLFTQDSGLTRDLLQINDHESTNRTRNKIFVARHVSKQGIVVFNDREQFVRRMARSAPTKAQTGNTAPSKSPPPAAVIKFRSCSKPRPSDDHIIGNGAAYGSRSTVYNSTREPVLLGLALARGGEGEIFEVDSSRVAKIYFHDRRTRSRRDKLHLMCSHPLTIRGVAWPQSVLNDAAGDFIGFMMPKAKGTPLQHCAFGKSALAEHFPSWKRKDLVELALTYAGVIAQIHKHGLIVGDINPMNVLVASNHEICVVDVDSFQVEDFPCPVGMATFRAPEITDPNFAAFIRTERHEMFALTSLLFMILMGGKSPYSFQGGGDPSENIRQGNFPYVKDTSAIPAGAYRYIWSYLPRSIQDAFGRTFADPSPEGRPTSDLWVRLLADYLRALEREPAGSDAHALWPASFRPWKSSQTVQLQCASCRTNFQTSAKDAAKRKQFPSILCGNCLAALTLAKKAGDSAACAKCGKPVHVPFGHSSSFACYCDSCLEAESTVPRSCKECHRGFYIEPGVIDFFWRKQLHLPRKCGPCRGRPEYVPPARPQVRAIPTAPTYRSTPLPPYSPPQPPVPSRSIWQMLKDFFS